MIAALIVAGIAVAAAAVVVRQSIRRRRATGRLDCGDKDCPLHSDHFHIEVEQ